MKIGDFVYVYSFEDLKALYGGDFIFNSDRYDMGYYTGSPFFITPDMEDDRNNSDFGIGIAQIVDHNNFDEEYKHNTTYDNWFWRLSFTKEPQKVGYYTVGRGTFRFTGRYYDNWMFKPICNWCKNTNSKLVCSLKFGCLCDTCFDIVNKNKYRGVQYEILCK